jgi:hypothetical protein
MKINFFIFILILKFYLAGSVLQGQPVADTTRQQDSMVAPQKADLPTIQLEDYTIIGRAKISLPRKVRTQLFQSVGISWTENEQVYEKELPEINFQFSRVKPSLFRLYDFPWLDSRIHYGSYNTAGINVKMQFRAQNILPYLSADFQRSDGHLDNAQWTTASLQAGIHQKMSEIHLLHLYTDYQLNKRGIWGYWDIYQQDWETNTTFWETGGELEDQWSEKIRTYWKGKYLLDDHENAFDYSERGYDLTAGAKINVNNTGIGLQIDLQNSDLEIDDGNLIHQQHTSSLRENVASIFSSRIDLQQNFHSVTAEIGMLYQKSENQETRAETLKDNEEQFNPVVSLSAGFQGMGKIYARYRPGLEINHFRYALKAIPFSEIDAMKILNYKSRWEAGFDLQIPGGINFQLLSRYSEVENYLTVTAHTDSLRAIFTGGGYPGWIFANLEKVKIQEIFGKFEWNLKSKLYLLAWLNWRQSDIRKAGEFSENILGNEVPYLPALSGYGGLRWNFYQRHELKIWIDYLSSRYDDLNNQVKVNGFVLLNTSLQLRLGENFSFVISGQNLLDTRYDEFQGFAAPGITGWFGLKLTM